MIYPNKPLYLLSLLGYIYYLTYYTLTTKDNIFITSISQLVFLLDSITFKICLRNCTFSCYYTAVKSVVVSIFTHTEREVIICLENITLIENLLKII